MSCTQEACPSCFKKEHRYLGDVRQKKVLACRSCGLVFIETEQILPYDHGDWYAWLDLDERTGDYYLRTRMPYYSRQLKELSNLSGGRVIVDVGSGMGVFAKVASIAGWDIKCVEINSKARLFGKDIYGLDYVEMAELRSGTADVVRLCHLLEHVGKPRELLAEANRVLKRGGLCAIIVPHYEPLSCVIKNMILKAIPGRHDFRGFIYAPSHLLGFTKTSIANMMRFAGFETARLVCVSQGDPAYYPWNYWRVRLADLDLRNIVYELANNFGNFFGRGSWIVGYFRKL